MRFVHVFVGFKNWFSEEIIHIGDIGHFRSSLLSASLLVILLKNKTTQPEKEDWIQKEIQKTKEIKNNHDFLILPIRFCVGSCILLSFLSFFLFSYSFIRTKQTLNKINAISYKKKTIIINSKINSG